VMGTFTLPRGLSVMCWISTAVMAVAAVGMVASWFF